MKNKIKEGCLVKCIKSNNDPTIPVTKIDQIYRVTEYITGYWIKLKRAGHIDRRFKFDIKRFEFCEEKETYPTINEEYFK